MNYYASDHSFSTVGSEDPHNPEGVNMSKRAERRHHLRRMKAKARKVYYFNSPDRAIRLADHLASCSCCMCGNPRKWLKEKTRKEYESELKTEEGRHDTEC